MFKTQQELFDNAWNGFESQNWQYSVGLPGDPIKENLLRYRQDMTATCPVRCGIGWNISDEKYSSWIEGYPVVNPQIMELAGIQESDKFFVQELQNIHDVCAKINHSSKEFKKRMISFATAHYLKVPQKVLEEV